MNQTVGIFIGAALIEAAGVCKIQLQARVFFEAVAVREFASLVEGDRVATLLVQFFQPLLDSLVYMDYSLPIFAFATTHNPE